MPACFYLLVNCFSALSSQVVFHITYSRFVSTLGSQLRLTRLGWLSNVTIGHTFLSLVEDDGKKGQRIGDDRVGWRGQNFEAKDLPSG